MADALRSDVAPAEPALQILHLEDDPLDAELAASVMESDGLTCVVERVDTRQAFETALVTQSFDLILSDYNLPGFDGLTAQGMARRLCPNVPFIFLSGALGEDLAADRMKDGATDFVLKQRLAKLPIAVRRARREAEQRAQTQRAEEALRAMNAELEERVRRRSADLAATTTTLARREAELGASQKRLEAILQYSPHLIEVKDLEGRYLLVNPEVQRVLGRSAVSMIGRSAHELMPPRLADVVRAHDQEVIKEKRPGQFEESILTPDGVRVFASTRFPLYDADGRMTGVCAISHNITGRKTVEDEIKLARLEALRATHAKNQFLSQMSHELRTPLNAILGFAQLFESESESMSAEQAENVGQILAGGRHLLELINEVIDIARVESGKLAISPEPIDALEVVRIAVDLVKPLAAQRGISIAITQPQTTCPTVRADRQRLSQVVLNLLSNAVKYNRQAGRITVAFERMYPRRMRILVTDTGAGIPPARLKLLFQPFQRLGAEQTEIEGSGLGLALSRALCEAMEGTLGVESVVDQGSTFWVELPLSDASVEIGEAVAIPARQSEAPSERRAEVLYVEDNLSNVRLMERVFARRPGLTLLNVSNGGAALARVRERQPDLVLLDMQLPDMSGEEVLRHLWEDPASRSIPVVILTADATPGLPRRLKAAGARSFLTKPLDVRQVLEVVDELLEQPCEL